ncbi:MAG TPA: DUF3347 domain-containing protein, partial [Chryseolinea sp.]|nr:DUF3347 domain-containing protein [Chryseolinea sp.]
MSKVYLFWILGIIALSVLINCTGSNKEKGSMQSGEADTLQPASGATAAAVASEPQFKVDETFQKQLGDVLTSYIMLKETFVASDSNSVPSKALAIRESLSNVEVALLSGEALKAGAKYLPALENSLKDIQSTNNLEKQRRAFRVLSDSLYATIKAFGLGGK